MFIDNTEALRSWLTKVLEPLCDADPSALARYVLALLKKDKPEKELTELMVEQLDVFLAEKTNPFVQQLFKAINSKEYLNLIKIEVVPKTEETSTINFDADVKSEKDTEQSDSIETKPIVVATSNSATVSKINSQSVEETKTKDTHNNQKVKDVTETNVGGAKDNSRSHPHSNNHVRSVSPPARINADKENQPRESRRRRASLRSRSRSRSRSNERMSRRSRSRDRRMNERERNTRQFRNKSPPTGESRYSSYERRRSGVNERRRMGGEDRSPRFNNNPAETVRKGRPNRSNSRSRSKSPERSHSKGSPSNARSARGSPERHHHAHTAHETEKRQRCRDFDEKGYCVRGETCPWDHGVNPVVFEGINNSTLMSMSMREYNPDSPDLWSRPGTAGIVGTNTPTAIIAGTTPVGNTSINPFSGTVRPTSVMMGAGTPAAIPYPPHAPGVDKTPNGTDYARSAAAGNGFRPTGPMMPFPFNPAGVTTPLQRELIPIPVVDASGGAVAGGDVGAVQQGKRRLEMEDSVAIADGPPKRKIPLNSRLGPRIPNMQNNCSLELRKVPRGLNTITHLNNHFSKFGKIVNIQVSYEGDPEAAIITFSTHAEANVAYRSTEAVLNNRFIKVFWHSQDASNVINSGESAANTMQSGGVRKNSQYHLNNVPAVPTPTADSAKITNTSVAAASQPSSSSSPTSGTATTNTTTTTAAPIDPSNATTTTASGPLANPPSLRLKNNAPRSGATNAIIRKKQEEQAKAVVQLANGLRKRKQELLQSYVKQVKSALELVERCEQNDPQRAKTLETIKTLQEAIDKLRKEIAVDQEQLQAQIQNQQPPPAKKTKEQQKKELLDIELELFAQQQEGNDTTAIQKRLEELQRSLGIAPGVAHGPSMGKSGHYLGSRPRIRPTLPEGSTRVDRRPKTIVVTGFASDEADFVLGHFKHFGEITKHDVDREIPQLILSYATRINAEQAMLRGKLFKDTRLQISWAPVVVQQTTNALISEKASQDENKTNDKDVSIEEALAIGNANEKVIGGDLDVGVPTSSDILPELRLEDEEDEEESEDRSWRR